MDIINVVLFILWLFVLPAFLVYGVCQTRDRASEMEDTDEDWPSDEYEYAEYNLEAWPELQAQDLQQEIFDEWAYARDKFGPFNSSHEGFAVLYEEFDELKAEVWKNREKYPERDAAMRKEAIQVAAMALRFLTDCCDHS